MSKSARNEFTLDDLEAGPPGGGGGFSPADFRYYCLTLHYATPMNFTWAGQAAAARALARLRDAFRNAASGKTMGEDMAAGLRARFREALEDDLNLPRAVAVAHEAARSGIGGDVARSLAAEWDPVLAVGLLPEVVAEAGRNAVPSEVLEMTRERDARRRERDYAGADALRVRIRAAGYDVVDAGSGPATLRKLQETRGR